MKTPEQARDTALLAEMVIAGDVGSYSYHAVVGMIQKMLPFVRAYADQAERLKEMEAAVGEYFRQNDEHARAMKAAIDAYHTDGFEGETKKAREASAKMDAAEFRLRSLMEEGE